MLVNFKVNGKAITLDVDGNITLLEVLRENLGLSGTKKGCETGECGACAVLVDGENVSSCMILIGEVEGKEVTTIEGLAKDGELDPVQIAFAELAGLQCGFCTPGMIISARALLNRNPNPTRAEIHEGLAGNLCRCTGYEQIIESVVYAMELALKGDIKNE